MRVEGAGMDAEQRIAVAEYLTRRRYAAEAIPQAAFCADAVWTGLDPAAVSWMGFAGNLAGTGYQPPERAGLDASDIPNLHLKWAFAPSPTEARCARRPPWSETPPWWRDPLARWWRWTWPPGARVGASRRRAAVRGAIAVGLDGVIRAHSTADGAVIWEYRHDPAGRDGGRRAGRRGRHRRAGTGRRRGHALREQPATLCSLRCPAMCCWPSGLRTLRERGTELLGWD